MRKIEKDAHKWENILCSLTEKKVILLKIDTYTTQEIYRFNIISTKIPMVFVTGIEKKLNLHETRIDPE